MKVEKIDHVSITVKDLNKARKLFSELFETDFLEPWPIESVDIMESIDPLGIDLCAPLKPDGLTAKVLAQRGEGITMMSFKVQNLGEAMAEMKAHGIRQLFSGTIGRANWAIFDPRDLFGVMIELIEYKAYPMEANYL